MDEEKDSIMTSEHKVSKDFFYAQDDISLHFNLRIDTTEELLIFRNMLEKAINDVNVEIKKINV